MPRQSFEEIVLPHLDAAFNYARWLTRSEADAEDVVQDAYMRAFRFFSSFRGEAARAAGRLPMSSIDETGDDPLDEGLDPEALLMQRQTVEHVRQTLETLPGDFRGGLVLRELEGLVYSALGAIG